MNEFAFSRADTYQYFVDRPAYKLADRLLNGRFDNGTDCGYVFNSNHPNQLMNMSELKRAQYIQCLMLLQRGYDLSQRAPGIPMDVYFDYRKARNSSSNVVRSTPFVFAWLVSNSSSDFETYTGVDDPTAKYFWYAIINRTKKAFNRVEKSVPESGSSGVGTTIWMGKEIFTKSLNLASKFYGALQKNKVGTHISNLITHTLEQSEIYRSSSSTLSKRNHDSTTTTLQPENNGIVLGNNTFALQMALLAEGMSGYYDIITKGGDYSAMAHNGPLINISNLLDLLINGRNQSYSDVPQVFPGFQCQLLDRWVFVVVQRTSRCVDIFLNTTSFAGSWGNSLGVPIVPSITSYSLKRPGMFDYRPSVTVGNKDDDLTTFVFDMVDWLSDTFFPGVFGSVASWPQDFLEQLERDGVSAISDPNDRGLFWYVAFPFYCSQEKLHCEHGYGLWDGFWKASLAVIVYFAVIGFLPAGISDVAKITVSMVFIPAVYLAFMFGYSPACFPRLPECSAREVANVFNITSEPCINWPNGATDDTCTKNCPELRSFMDCRDLGFLDGFDEILFYLEWKLPSVMDWFRASPFFTIVTYVNYFKYTLENTNLQGLPPSDAQKWCFYNQLMTLGQLIVLLGFGGATAAIAAIVAYSIIAAVFTFITQFFLLISSISNSVEMSQIKSRFDE
jgi:hypothetical protein